MLLSMDTLKFPLEKAVTDHRTRLNMIAVNDTSKALALMSNFGKRAQNCSRMTSKHFLNHFIASRLPGSLQLPKR